MKSPCRYRTMGRVNYIAPIDERQSIVIKHLIKTHTSASNTHPVNTMKESALKRIGVYAKASSTDNTYEYKK